MSPRTPLQYEEIREEKKALIMDEALEQFSETGFQATTINQIAEHAGISKGLIYNYFKSKEDLLAAIINRSLNDIYINFNPDHDNKLTPDEFEMFIRRVFSLFREKRKFWKLIYRTMLQRGVYENLINGNLQTINISGMSLKDFSQNMMSLLADYFNRKKETAGPGYDPIVELLMFSNTVKGFALTYIFSEGFYREDYFEKMTDALIKRYR